MVLKKTVTSADKQLFPVNNYFTTVSAVAAAWGTSAHLMQGDMFMVFGKSITVSMKGFSDMRDITGKVGEVVAESAVKNGIVTVFATGSTASISTVEYEPALVKDVQERLEELAPRTMRSRHSETWGDDNGFSHIRATIMGPGITVPVSGGRLVLGTWQQIVVIDHDNRPRTRNVYLQVMGE
jgi:secondary thiamine-phosphate synthase enzyme